jgi:hypothetical protein
LKKICLIFLCILILGSMLLVKPARAGNAVYSITEYPAVAACTVDGKWTTTDEWTDAPITDMTGNATGKFGYDIQDFTNLGLEWLIEIFGDNTNDTGDYVQICLDDANNGGSAPKTTAFMVEIDGHTTLKVFQGTGSGWTQVTPASGEITWNCTIAASPLNSTPHWIYEVVDSSKTAGTVQVPSTPPTGMRVAAYDASDDTICSWAPNSSANVPDQWGLIATYSSDPIPESTNLGVIVILSCVAVVASLFILRKRPKTIKTP